MLRCRGFGSFGAAVDAWYDEVKQYNFARQGFSAATGHFTQLVWKDTSRVGCAVNPNCSYRTYICQYSPPGGCGLHGLLLLLLRLLLPLALPLTASNHHAHAQNVLAVHDATAAHHLRTGSHHPRNRPAAPHMHGLASTVQAM